MKDIINIINNDLSHCRAYLNLLRTSNKKNEINCNSIEELVADIEVHIMALERGIEHNYRAIKKLEDILKKVKTEGDWGEYEQPSEMKLKKLEKEQKDQEMRKKHFQENILNLMKTVNENSQSKTSKDSEESTTET